MSKLGKLERKEIENMVKSLDFLDEVEKRARTPALQRVVERQKVQLLSELAKRGISKVGQVDR